MEATPMRNHVATKVYCRCGRYVKPENWKNHMYRKDGRPHLALGSYPAPESRLAEAIELLSDLVAQMDHSRTSKLADYEIEKARSFIEETP